MGKKEKISLRARKNRKGACEREGKDFPEKKKAPIIDKLVK